MTSKSLIPRESTFFSVNADSPSINILSQFSKATKKQKRDDSQQKNQDGLNQDDEDDESIEDVPHE